MVASERREETGREIYIYIYIYIYDICPFVIDIDTLREEGCARSSAPVSSRNSHYPISALARESRLFATCGR